jgi:hypothetical protein
MPYISEISRTNPACFVFLLDQSRSMVNAFSDKELAIKKADFLADVVNRSLHDLVIRCTTMEDIRDYYQVAILGYGAGRGNVKSAFQGVLAGRSFIGIREIGQNPARLDDRTRRVSDGAGGLVEQRIRFPIWIDQLAANDTPMCAGLSEAHTLVSGWLAEHPNSFPPVVLHITDGGSTDGNPTRYADSIASLRSSDGHVLLFNCHLSSMAAPKLEYPNDDSSIGDNLARMLFRMSSELPQQFRDSGNARGMRLLPGAKGFVFNSDAASLVHFFELGTKPANLH